MEKKDVIGLMLIACAIFCLIVTGRDSRQPTRVVAFVEYAIIFLSILAGVVLLGAR